MAKRKPENVSQRSYVGLLYADNAAHMRVLKRLQRGQYPFAACWHIEKQNGREIVCGEGKKHLHFVLHFSSVRKWPVLAEKLGFEWGDSGAQFLRPVGYDRKRFPYPESSDPKKRLYGALAYLVHRNCPEKEQYHVKRIFGDSCIVALARDAVQLEEERQISKREALAAIAMWVGNQTEPISAIDFFCWVKDTPFFRYAESQFARRMIEDRNRKLYAAIAAQYGTIDISPSSRLGPVETDNPFLEEGEFAF